jgi:hypothetical protein
MSSYWTYGRLDTALAGGERSTYFYGSELNGVIWQVFAFALRVGSIWEWVRACRVTATIARE